MSDIRSLFGRGSTASERGPAFRRGALWGGVSLALHLVVALLLLAIATEIPRQARVTLVPIDLGTPESDLLPYSTRAPTGRRVPPPPKARRPAAGQGVQAAPEQKPSPEEQVAQRPTVLPEQRDSNAVAFVVPTARTHRLLRPGYGDGRLWVPPVDILDLGRLLPSARSVARAGRGGGGAGGAVVEGPPTVAQLDSAVTARLRAFLDTLPADSFAPPQAPSWTTEIDGKTWGIDGKWIYLGGLKLPAALLALLPFPQGNIDQSRAANQLMMMREDIMQAARRAETTDEFRKYVNELRKRKEQEREAKKRAVGDTIIP